MRYTLLAVPFCFGVAAAIIVPMCMVKPAKPVTRVEVVRSDTTRVREAGGSPRAKRGEMGQPYLPIRR